MLYALSLLGTVRPGDKGFSRQMKSAALLADVAAEEPEPPGRRPLHDPLLRRSRARSLGAPGRRPLCPDRSRGAPRPAHADPHLHPARDVGPRAGLERGGLRRLREVGAEEGPVPLQAGLPQPGVGPVRRASARPVRKGQGHGAAGGRGGGPDRGRPRPGVGPQPARALRGGVPSLGGPALARGSAPGRAHGRAGLRRLRLARERASGGGPVRGPPGQPRQGGGSGPAPARPSRRSAGTRATPTTRSRWRSWRPRSRASPSS